MRGSVAGALCSSSSIVVAAELRALPVASVQGRGKGAGAQGLPVDVVPAVPPQPGAPQRQQPHDVTLPPSSLPLCPAPLPLPPPAPSPFAHAGAECRYTGSLPLHCASTCIHAASTSDSSSSKGHPPEGTPPRRVIRLSHVQRDSAHRNRGFRFQPSVPFLSTASGALCLCCCTDNSLLL